MIGYPPGTECMITWDDEDLSWIGKIVIVDARITSRALYSLSGQLKVCPLPCQGVSIPNPYYEYRSFEEEFLYHPIAWMLPIDRLGDRAIERKKELDIA